MDPARAMETLKILDALNREGRLDNGNLADALRRVAFKNPEVAFTYMKESSLDSRTKDFSAVAATAIRSATESQPEETLGYLLDPSATRFTLFIQNAFELLLGKDETAAENWYAQNNAAMSGAQKDQFLAAQVNRRAKQNEYEATREMVDQITDPVLRDQVRQQIWTTEKKAVTEQVKNDPVGTLEDLISDQSKHATPWIEEAVVQWMGESAAEADQWYQDVGEHLPPEKLQYVAAAYARKALKQGDRSLARQWIEMIRDESVRQRLTEVLGAP